MSDRNHNVIVPRSFFRWPASLPNLWEEVEDRMSQLGQWMGSGNDTGVTVSEDNNHVYVEAHLPGLQTDDLDISVHQNTLWIKGEKQEEDKNEDKKYYRRARNSFFYQVELPTQIEEESEHAQFQNGVLQITFRKTQKSQVRKIAIGRKTLANQLTEFKSQTQTPKEKEFKSSSKKIKSHTKGNK